MSVYDENGNALTAVYDANGVSLQEAYDEHGNVIFEANPLSIKVMTYNAGQWLTGGGQGTSSEGTYAANHRNLLQTIMTAQNPDILCIQEYWDVIGSVTVRSLLEQYFPYIQEVNGETNYFGHAIASKYPITNFVTARLSSNPTFLPVSESTNTNRFIDRCNITIEGRVFTVFNTHFALTESDRSNNANWLLALMKEQTNVITCGDFNTSCHDETDPDYTGVIHKFLFNGFHCANCSEFGFINTYTDTSDGSANWSPTDNIITSHNINIVDVWTDNTKLTDSLNEKIDHIPLIAELAVY